jgi:uncharacterized protein (UPF0332 family)
MNPEHVKALIISRLQQATECLDDARYLLAAARGTRTAVNRAYYAAFYAVLALLQTIGKAPRKHKGALALFDTEFVRTGILPKEFSMTVHQLFDARQEDDYRRFDPIPIEEANDFLVIAEQFVHGVREHLQRSGYLHEKN